MDVLTVLKSQWDRIAAVACVVGGVVLLILGYHGIADSPYVAQELAYLISGGLGGVFLLGVGATLYISADMHDEWRKLDRIEDAILSLAGDRVDSDTFADIVAPVAEARAARHGASGSANATAGAGITMRDGGGAAAMPRAIVTNLRAGAVAMSLALVALVLAYLRAATVSEADEAFGATAAAAAVLALAALVAIGGTVGLRRRMMRRRATLLTAFVTRARRSAPATGARVSARMPERLLVIPAGRFAHVAGCAMVAGESTRSVASADLPAGILPCALCTPAAL